MRVPRPLIGRPPSASRLVGQRPTGRLLIGPLPIGPLLVGIAAVALLVGCGAPGPQAGDPPTSASPAPTTSVTATPHGDPTSEPPPPQATASATSEQPPPPDASLPPPDPWQPAAGEIQPEVKVAAVRVIEALGTAPDAASTPAQRLTAVGADPALAGTSGALVPPAAPSVAVVVYPQYGGLTPDAASVMTVVRQSWLAEGDVVSRTVTVDVRLGRAGAGWQVTELRTVPPVDATTVDLPAAVAALVTGGRVDLPPAAAVDLATGADERVVEALTRLSETYLISVSVVRAGHPETIFGTDRPTNHMSGRAVDIWAIDDRPVVGLALDDPLLVAFLTAVAALGGDDVGGPVDLDGPGRIHFADALHRDHVHIAFDE